MTRKTPWKVCATTARPRTANVSHTTSPSATPAVKAMAPFMPPPSTRATMAAMPGPGEAAATNSAPVKTRSEVRSIMGAVQIDRRWAER